MRFLSIGLIKSLPWILRCDIIFPLQSLCIFLCCVVLTLVCFAYFISCCPKIHQLIIIACLSFQYINMRTQRISILLKKRFTTPNWVKVGLLFGYIWFFGKRFPALELSGFELFWLLYNFVQHKEPREVHMFVDLFLQEVSMSFGFHFQFLCGQFLCNLNLRSEVWECVHDCLVLLNYYFFVWICTYR